MYNMTHDEVIELYKKQTNTIPYTIGTMIQGNWKITRLVTPSFYSTYTTW